MQLKYKPDFEQAQTAWNHYWAREKWKRPLVVANVPKPGAPKIAKTYPHHYWMACHKQYDLRLEAIDQRMESILFLAESIPFSSPDHGPDQFAAFFGATLQFSENSPNTNWVEPFIDDWERALPLRFQPSNPVWQSVAELSQRMAAHAKGRYLVGVCDLHSNGDTLSALRGPQRLCMDFYDCPDLIARAMSDVRRAYPAIYNSLYEAGGMRPETGTIGWAPFWCQGKYATIQCDYLALVGPEQARQHILPALEEEAAFLDHCVLHFDGPGALPHLDDILAIDRIDVIQWVAGDGQPKMWAPEWRDILKRCQKAGKGLQIYQISIAQAKELHRQLDPAGLVYCIEGAKNESEVEEFCRWLEKNS